MHRALLLSVLIVVSFGPARSARAIELVSVELTPDQQLQSVFARTAEGWIEDFPDLSDAGARAQEILEAGDPSLFPRLVRHFRTLIDRADVRATFEVGESSPRTNGPSIHELLVAALDKQLDANEGPPLVHGAPLAGHYGIVIDDESIPFATVDESDLASPRTAYHVTPEQAAVLRLIGETFLSFPLATTGPERLLATQRLSEIDEAWDNYLSSGFSQYPWELLVNSALYDGPWYEPPVHQLVLLHPEPAVTLGLFGGARDAEINVGVMLHGIGYVHYFGEKRSFFLGGSAGLSLDNETGLGVGGAIHVGDGRDRGFLPHLSLGVYWTDFDEGGLDGEDIVVGLSVDVWRMLDQNGGERRFRDRALSLLRGGP